VAIYQALRFDFNISEAVALSLVQLFICLFVLGLSTLWKQETPIVFSGLSTTESWQPASHFVGLVLSALNSAFVNVLAHPGTQSAFFNTVFAATTAAFLSIAMAVGLLLISRHCHYRLGWQSTSRWIRLMGNIILVLLSYCYAPTPMSSVWP